MPLNPATIAVAPLPFFSVPTIGSLAVGIVGLWAVWGVLEQLAILVRGREDDGGGLLGGNLMQLGLLLALLLVLFRR
jgi:hypothetical protein